jgi:hypothetical protein
MDTSAKAFRFDESTLWIDLQDGRTVGVPLAWFPRLLNASTEQRAAGRIGPTGKGLHWDDLDEDISVAGVLAGRGDVTNRPSAAA